MCVCPCECGRVAGGRECVGYRTLRFFLRRVLFLFFSLNLTHTLLALNLFPGVLKEDSPRFPRSSRGLEASPLRIALPWVY